MAPCHTVGHGYRALLTHWERPGWSLLFRKPKGAGKQFDSVGLGGASEAGPGYFHAMQFLSSYLIKAKEKVQTYSILQTGFLFIDTSAHSRWGRDR